VIGIGDERVEELLHVDEHDRLLVQVKLRVGDRLRQLVERAQPPGQHDEAVARREHARLALVHRLGDFELRRHLQGRLEMAQEIGNHAQHMRAAVRRRARNDTHQSHAAAAEYQIHAVGGDQRTHALGGVAIDGVLAEGGAAEDTNGGAPGAQLG
jgi:hypothetical protein